MSFFNKTYQTRRLCTNCNREVIIKIPFGIPAEDFIISGRAICSFCGCSIVKTSGVTLLPNAIAPLQQTPPRELPPLPPKEWQKQEKKRGRPKKTPPQPKIDSMGKEIEGYYLNNNDKEVKAWQS